jgi:hypothetical protein
LSHKGIKGIAYYDENLKKIRKYFPDFYLKSTNMYVEIKGNSNNAIREAYIKIDAAEKCNHSLKFVVLTRKDLIQIGAWKIDVSKYKVKKMQITRAIQC